MENECDDGYDEEFENPESDESDSEEPSAHLVMNKDEELLDSVSNAIKKQHPLNKVYHLVLRQERKKSELITGYVGILEEELVHLELFFQDELFWHPHCFIIRMKAFTCCTRVKDLTGKETYIAEYFFNQAKLDGSS